MTKVYTYSYDSTYDPAMPVVDIEIGRAGAEPTLSLTALVDSGADGTIIPMDIHLNGPAHSVEVAAD